MQTVFENKCTLHITKTKTHTETLEILSLFRVSRLNGSHLICTRVHCPIESNAIQYVCDHFNPKIDHIQAMTLHSVHTVHTYVGIYV